MSRFYLKRLVNFVSLSHIKNDAFLQTTRHKCIVSILESFLILTYVCEKPYQNFFEYIHISVCRYQNREIREILAVLE